MQIDIKVAEEAHATGIREIFRSCYGDTYTYPEFYEISHLKRLIFGDDALMLVAVADDGTVVGTASVILEVGAYTDLVGEFGRLAVHPDARCGGIGARLLEARVEHVRDRLHVGLIEGRVTHPYTQRICRTHGFSPVGFVPMALRFGDHHRESCAVLVRYFGDALELRRNHPRVVPEVYELAGMAMTNVGLTPDAIVDETASAYPTDDELEFSELTSEGYAPLLRIERGRVRQREVFGPLSLHYGLFKIQSTSSCYLIARRGEHIVGAIGFNYDSIEHNLRVFELISLDPGAARFLLERLEEMWRDNHQVFVVEIDVSAHATRLQRTLVELGYVPAAYQPAFAFDRVERVDVIRFIRLGQPLDPGELDLVSPSREIADRVIGSLRRGQMLPEIERAIDAIKLFDGLSPSEAQRLAAACTYAEFDAGAEIFAPGGEATEMYLLTGGAVDIRRPSGEHVGRVQQGQSLGEVALLSGARHSAHAIAAEPVTAAVLTREGLDRLVRKRPAMGVTVYRNLARDTGAKLLHSGRLGPAETD